MIDYARYERAQGLNWYAADPDLRFLMDYHLDAADHDWAEAHLQRMGALRGGPIAERSETVDKNPPRLERYDRWGEEINEVVHHPASLATKRDLWEHGSLGLPWSREVKERSRPVPSVLLQAFQYGDRPVTRRSTIHAPSRVPAKKATWARFAVLDSRYSLSVCAAHASLQVAVACRDPVFRCAHRLSAMGSPRYCSPKKRLLRSSSTERPGPSNRMSGTRLGSSGVQRLGSGTDFGLSHRDSALSPQH